MLFGCCHPLKHPETAFCADDGIEQVNFVDVAVSNISEIGQTTSRRRMQGTLRSEAFQAHEVRSNIKKATGTITDTSRVFLRGATSHSSRVCGILYELCIL